MAGEARSRVTFSLDSANQPSGSNQLTGLPDQSSHSDSNPVEHEALAKVRVCLYDRLAMTLARPIGCPQSVTQSEAYAVACVKFNVKQLDFGTEQLRAIFDHPLDVLLIGVRELPHLHGDNDAMPRQVRPARRP